MVTLVLRETGASPKGSPLTNAELDNNFKNLDDGKQNTHPTLAALVGLSGSAGKIPVFSSETGMTTVDITATPDPKAFSVPATSVTRVAEAVHAALSHYGFYSNDATINIDTLPGGWCGLVSTSLGGTMPPLSGGFFWLSCQQTYSGQSQLQTAVQYGGSATDPNSVSLFPGMAIRVRNQPGTAWGPWGKLFTSRDTVSSNLDQTAGKLLTVGYQGLGADAAPALLDMNLPFGSGFSWATSGTANLWPGFASGSNFITASASTSEVAQIGFSRTTPLRVGVRRKTSGSWQAMQEVALYAAGTSYVPIANGGTGGTTAETARTALGLTLAAHNADTTPDRVLKTGYQGIGAPAVGINNWADAYGLGCGWVYGNAGYPGGTGESINAVALNMMLNHGPIGAQIMAYCGDSQLKFRTAYNGFGPWCGVYHTANVTRDPGLTENPGLMFYGSNANGEFWKYANGMLVCKTRRTFNLAVTVQADGMFVGNCPDWTFPVGFVGDLPVILTNSAIPGRVTIDGSNIPNNTSVTPALISMVSIASSLCYQGLVAVGRWK